MNEMLRRVVHATGASVEQVDACLSYMWENGMQYDNEAEVVKEVLRATTSPQPAPAAVPTSETPAAVIVDVLDAVQTLNSWLLGQGQGSSRDERIQMLLKSAALEKVFALLLSDPAQWIGRSEVKGSFASLLSSLLPNSTAVLESLDTILSYSHDTVLQPVIARTLAGIVREHSLSLAFQRVQDSQCNDPSVPTIFSERELALERVHRLLGIGKKCVDSSLSSSFIAELEAAVQSCAVNASTTSSAYSIQVNTDFDVRNKQTLLQELKAQRSALANRLQTLDAEIARIAEEIDDSQQQYQQLGVDAVSSQLEGRGINADSALQHLVSTVRCFHSCVQAVCCEPDGNGESCTADESTVKDTLSLYIGAELQCARFLADRIFSSRHRVEQLSREMAVYGSLSMKSLTSGCERELRTLKSQIDGDVLSLVEIVKTVDVTVGLVEEGALAASGDSLVQLVAVINRSGASIPQRLQKYRAEQEIDYSQLAAAPLSMSAPQTALLAKPVAEDTAATAKPNIRGKGFAGKNGRSAKPRSGNPKGDKAEKNGHRVETLVAISQLERITAGKSVVRSNASQASETCSAAQQDGSRVGPRTTGKISLLDIQVGLSHPLPFTSLLCNASGGSA